MENLNTLTLALVLSGGLLCFLALKLLWKRRIFNHLLILIVCLVLLCGGAFSILAGLNFLTYLPVPNNNPLAILYFKREYENRYNLRIKDYKGGDYAQTITGDYWQLEARVVSLDKRLPLNIEPVIRLEHLYVMERTSKNGTKFKSSSKALHIGSTIDVGKLIERVPWLGRMISFRATRTLNTPLEDVTVYTITYTPLGLIAKRTSVSENSGDIFEFNKYD